jgi:hypothetical protein
MDDFINNIYEKLKQQHVEINYIVNKDYWIKKWSHQ